MAAIEKERLGEPGVLLQQIADLEGLDSGYGEFDFLISTILATRRGMSPKEFNEKYEWHQDALTDPIILKERG